MNVSKESHRDYKIPFEDYLYAKSAKIFDTEKLFLSKEIVPPGKKASKPHFHSDYDEIAFVLKGELTAVEGDQKQTLNEGDSIYFHANSKLEHYLKNETRNDAEFLIIKSK
jgi:uncharacterized cupin superfamily protein